MDGRGDRGARTMAESGQDGRTAAGRGARTAAPTGPALFQRRADTPEGQPAATAPATASEGRTAVGRGARTAWSGCGETGCVRLQGEKPAHSWEAGEDQGEGSRSGEEEQPCCGQKIPAPQRRGWSNARDQMIAVTGSQGGGAIRVTAASRRRRRREGTRCETLP